MKLAGYLFNGRFYKELDELRGKTMAEGNKPQPLYFAPTEVKEQITAKQFYLENDYYLETYDEGGYLGVNTDEVVRLLTDYSTLSNALQLKEIERLKEELMDTGIERDLFEERLDKCEIALSDRDREIETLKNSVEELLIVNIKLNNGLSARDKQIEELKAKADKLDKLEAQILKKAKDEDESLHTIGEYILDYFDILK